MKDSPLAKIISSGVNLLSFIFARIYFPTYSNGLKEVVSSLGFVWSHTNLSGPSSIASRLEWELSADSSLKRRLFAYNAEDCNGMDGGSRASTTGQDETKVDEAGEPWAVDEAFEILVRNAIDKFGFAPHDVYEGVFRLSTATTDHTNAVRNLRWAELKLIISTFTREMSLDVGSHRVVAVYPLPNPPSDYRDGWSIEIKSYEITRQVLDRLKEEEDISIREVIDYFRKIPEGSTYAGGSR